MSTAPLTREQLVAAFHAAGTPRKNWLVGAEFERHLLQPNGRPLPYSAPRGVRWLLEHFHDDGWEVSREGEYPIALRRQGAWITLEPGGQFELSGAPHATLQGVHDEGVEFVHRVAHALEGTSVRQVALGYTPFATMDEVDWVPKGRYVVMREHLGQTGALAHHMMKGTCAVQASYDFSDEEDCARKVQVSTALGPLTTALFANSPYKQGQATPFMSYRGHIWTQTDPLRTGFPSAAVDFRFAAWVDWLLDMPMLFRMVDGQWRHAGDLTFRAWMANDEPGPTWDDWELHMTSVFPEVRVKTTIEVRGADAVPMPLAMAFTAIWHGIFYNDQALDAASRLAQRFTSSGPRQEIFATACRDGLRGVVAGRSLADWAAELISLVPTENQRWLKPIAAYVDRGESPAHRLLQELGPTPSPHDLMHAADIVGE